MAAIADAPKVLERVQLQTSFDMQSHTRLEPSDIAAFQAKGITIQRIGRDGPLQVTAPDGGRVEFTNIGPLAGEVGDVFDAAGKKIADYVFAPGGPTGGNFARLELKE